MRTKTRFFSCLTIIAAVVILNGACTVDGNDDDADLTGPIAAVEGPVAGSPTLTSTVFSLRDQGYQQEEFFVSGSARAYVNVNALDPDGRWQVEPADEAAYRTRIVVNRPMQADDFNGMVIVEWLNVSAGFDTAPDWGMAHTEFIRRGYAWVGVSAQMGGVADLKAKAAQRYEALIHPGDSFSYDIYSQIGRAIRAKGKSAPLAGLSPQYLVAAGESQSALRMMTYVNSLAVPHNVYDGYFVHSRLDGSAPLSQDPQPLIPTPDIVRVRDDLDTPVIMLQTETDILILGSYGSRQEDSAGFRLWEVAGTAHADLYTYLDGAFDVGTDPAIAAVVENAKPVPLPGFPACDKPVNAGPQHFVVNAAFRALSEWIADGVAPATADRLEVAGDPPAFAVDALGNVKGGVRTPHVDVPIAVLSGEGQSGEGFCFISGTTELFDEVTLGTLYGDNDTYVAAVHAAADDAVEKGFLLAADAALIKTHATESDIFLP